MLVLPAIIRLKQISLQNRTAKAPPMPDLRPLTATALESPVGIGFSGAITPRRDNQVRPGLSESAR